MKKLKERKRTICFGEHGLIGSKSGESIWCVLTKKKSCILEFTALFFLGQMRISWKCKWTVLHLRSVLCRFFLFVLILLDQIIVTLCVCACACISLLLTVVVVVIVAGIVAALLVVAFCHMFDRCAVTPAKFWIGKVGQICAPINSICNTSYSWPCGKNSAMHIKVLINAFVTHYHVDVERIYEFDGETIFVSFKLNTFRLFWLMVRLV